MGKNVVKVFLMLCLSFFSIVIVAYGQTKEFVGTVTDSSGQPISGAMVHKKGENKSTITDANGIFKISINDGQTLVIQALNYEIEEYTPGNLSEATITLKGSSGVMDEVVVIAYGSQRKANVTGALTTITSDKIADRPFSSVDKALQGQVAGLQITSASGAPGAGTDIRLRGIGSIAAGSNPLWVIDGTIAQSGDLTSQTTSASALSSINPDDIESITVLKDASATAIYGSRAANGVILVTTKKGKAGTTKINFSGTWGGNSNAYYNKNNRPMTTSEYMKALSQALINSGEGGVIDQASANTYMVNGYGVDSTVSTDWRKLVLQTGLQSQYNLSLSGGNEKTQFYASSGLFNQEGSTIASHFKRYNGTLSVNHKATDKLSISASVTGSYSDLRIPSNGGAYSNPSAAMYWIVPWYNPYNSNGGINYGSTDDYGGGNGDFPLLANGGFNPLAVAAFDKNWAKTFNLRGYVSGEYKILDNLKFTSKFSGEYYNVNEYSYQSPFYGDGYADENPGNTYSNNSNFFNWTFTNLLNYKANLTTSKDLTMDLTLGQESYKYNYNYSNASASGLPLNLQLYDMVNAAVPKSAATGLAYNATSSYLSNVVFNYKSKYILSGSFRRDGSSVFGVNHKWGNFFSIGGSWNVNEEAFLANVKWINLLKIRSSYGENGNSSGFGNYQSIATYAYGYNYGGSAGSAPSNVGNPDLTWEKNKNFDLGIDWTFFGNRFSGTVDYYNRKTSDLLINVPFSYTTGYSGGQLMNVGSMRNKGIEITISGTPIKTKDFAWDISFNIAHNQNRVLKLYEGNSISNGRFQITEGHDIQEYYLRNWKGVDPTNGNPVWYTDGGDSLTTSSPTQAKLDFTGKSASPKWFGGFTNTFSYKGFSLTATFNYNFGNYLYDGWANYYQSDGSYYGSTGQSNMQLLAWTPENTNTIVPKLSTENAVPVSSTRFLYSGKYIRLRNVQFTYTIPSNVLNRLKISSASVFVNATNFWTFGTDKYLPFDPEQGVTNVTNFNAPALKTIVGGVRIGL